MASVARITDIRGLVSLNDGEEILKEKDPVSENGGILTISDFARIIFDDGREIEVQGPVQITLNENFFQTGEFDIQDVQVGDINLAQNIIQNLATNLEGEGLLDNPAEGFVRTEQLDPDNINFGNNDIDFVLEDEEQILNPVTDAPAAGETPAAQIQMQEQKILKKQQKLLKKQRKLLKKLFQRARLMLYQNKQLMKIQKIQ
ncbi:MAG: hypothetical protein IPG15_04835 [Arcobacter sp.]|nr:hypothetical protein [Arcobacter sp.]